MAGSKPQAKRIVGSRGSHMIGTGSHMTGSDVPKPQAKRIVGSRGSHMTGTGSHMTGSDVPPKPEVIGPEIT